MPKSVSGLKKILSDPQQKRRWQGGLGLLVFAFFVLSSVVVSRTVQALNLAAGNYGYYGGTYGYNASVASSDQVPATVGSQAVGVGDSQAVVSWAEVTTTRTAATSYDNHSTYRVVYNTTDNVITAYGSNNGSASLPSGASAWTSSNDTLLATRGTIRTTITGLTNDTAYYFAVYACDTNVNCSDAPSASVTGTPAAGGGGGGGGGGTSAGAASGAIAAAPAAAAPAAAPAAAVASVATSVAQDAAQLAQAVGVARNTASEASNATRVASSASEFGVSLAANVSTVATNFVTYGTTAQAVQKLGSGERLAVVRDILETLGSRVANNAGDFLLAAEQISSGKKPTIRNLSKEVAQAGIARDRYFKPLTGISAPDFKNAKHDLAWNTMLYRVRFSRDLNKERVGIGKFRVVFKRLPTSPMDWATVRAWGYVLQ